MEDTLIALASVLATLVVGQGAAITFLFVRLRNNRADNPGHGFHQVEETIREATRATEVKIDAGFKGIHERLDRQIELLSRMDERTSR